MALSYDLAGDGPTVVLLHSGVCDRRMWDPQWPALRDAGYQVVRCDSRGFGRSPLPDRPYNNAEDVAGLLSDLGIGRAALIASSSGGRVALEMAARWPDRVTSLALLCSDSPDAATRSEALRSFAEQEDALLAAGDVDGAVDLNVRTFVGPAADDAVRERVRRMQREVFDLQLSATEEFPQIRAEVDLSRVAARCLAVSGGHDLPDFRAFAASLPERLADARHHELPWAGHLPGLERPAAVTELLLRFLHETLGSDEGRHG